MGGASFPSEYTASDQSKAERPPSSKSQSHIVFHCLFLGIPRMEAQGGVSQSTRPTKDVAGLLEPLRGVYGGRAEGET